LTDVEAGNAALQLRGNQSSSTSLEVPSALEDTNGEQIQQESVTHRYHAESPQRYFKADGLLEDLVAFRNVVLIFHGPVTSTLDSEEAKSRKAFTRERCEKISALGPDGVLSWALTLAPHLWDPGVMGREVFDYLLKEADTKEGRVWSARVCGMLLAVGAGQLKQKSHEYQEFLKGSFQAL